MISLLVLVYFWTDFGGHGFSNFRNLDPFSFSFKFPNSLVHGLNQIGSVQKFTQVGVDAKCMHTNFCGTSSPVLEILLLSNLAKFSFRTMQWTVAHNFINQKVAFKGKIVDSINIILCCTTTSHSSLELSIAFTYSRDNYYSFFFLSLPPSLLLSFSPFLFLPPYLSPSPLLLSPPIPFLPASSFLPILMIYGQLS